MRHFEGLIEFWPERAKSQQRGKNVT